MTNKSQHVPVQYIQTSTTRQIFSSITVQTLIQKCAGTLLVLLFFLLLLPQAAQAQSISSSTSAVGPQEDTFTSSGQPHAQEAQAETDIAQVQLDLPNIVGGNVALSGAWPWMAYLQVGRKACGGSLIHRRWVLTAAHCIYSQNGYQIDASTIFATLGRQRLTSNVGERIGVKRVIVHPSYRHNTRAKTYDIALLELSRSSSYQTMPMLDVPTASLVQTNRQATVTGWGGIRVADSNSNISSNVLKQLTLPIVSANRCGVNSSLELCLNYVLYKEGSCYGDSGGPLMVFNPQNKKWTQIGIVSKIVNNRCSTGYGIYTRVSSFRNWIISNIGSTSTAPTTTNLAQGRKASAQSQWSSSYRSSYGNDGRNNTSWSSNRTTQSWWYVDLGRTRTFNQININWQNSYAGQYRIAWYTNGRWYTIAYTVRGAGTYTHSIGRRNARFVGVFLDQRAPGKSNYSFREFEVYNKAGARRPSSLEGNEEVQELSITQIPSGLFVDESYYIWLPVINR